MAVILKCFNCMRRYLTGNPMLRAIGLRGYRGSTWAIAEMLYGVHCRVCAIALTGGHHGYSGPAAQPFEFPP